MSRGDRSRPARERTPEERERDREERARRRAERAGTDGGGVDPGATWEPPPPEPAMPHREDPAGSPQDATAAQDPTMPPPSEEPLAGPIMPPDVDPAPEPGPPLEHDPGLPVEHDPGASVGHDPGLPVEHDPGPPVEHDLEPLAEQAHLAEPDFAAAPGPEAEPGQALTQGATEPAWQDPPPAPQEPPTAAHEEATPAAGPPVPRPSWSARAPSPFVGRPGDRGRARGSRSALARLGAILALAGVIAAVVLLLRALLHKSHPKTVAAPAVVKVVIPEGKTRLQIAQIAAADGLTGNYRAAVKRSPLLNPTHYGAPRGTPDLEGFLFPATYDMDPHAPVSRLVQEQLGAFVENFGVSEIARARALHVTPYQLLTIASMIEREAEVPGDRPKIAAVIYNRLRRGMPLAIDATIYYAIELRQGIATLTSELTEAQLRINSAYNTRIHTGLPPTPISNPGVASIKAAANPAHAPYLYYVAAPDGCGEHVFSTTLAAFEANAAAYHAALRKNGGHLPACHKK